MERWGRRRRRQIFRQQAYDGQRVTSTSTSRPLSQGPPPPSILDAFLSNPLVFLAGAFVGVMELDVTSEDSDIAPILQTARRGLSQQMNESNE